MQAFRLDGQRALISGGSRGIGAAIACRFAEAGAEIGIIGRDPEGLAKTRHAVEKNDRLCSVIEADLSSVEGARRAGSRALEISPQWDVLVNNAGMATIKPVLEITLAEWNDTFALNLRSILLLSQAIVPPMIKRRAGKVINISSIGALIGTPGLAAYAASKAALNQLTRTMAVEWGAHNIQVNSICPTVVLTDMGHALWDDLDRADQRKEKEKRIPLHRFVEPEEVANVALFLASSASSFVHGVSLPLDGGLTISP